MSRFHLLAQFQLVCLCAKYGFIDRNKAFPCNYADIHVKVVLNQ